LSSDGASDANEVYDGKPLLRGELTTDRPPRIFPGGRGREGPAFCTPAASPDAPSVVAKPPMSRDADAKNLRLYDRRTIDRNIKKGLITRKDYEKYLKSLDDVKEKGIQGEGESVDEDDDDDETDALEADEADEAASDSNSHS
jgi:hypothetical protein